MVELQLTFDKESPYWVEDVDSNLKFIYERLGMFYDRVLENGFGTVAELEDLIGMRQYSESLKDNKLGWSFKDYSYIWDAIVEPWNDIVIVRIYINLDVLD